MPDDTDAASGNSKTEAAQEPKVRRISNKNPGKPSVPAPEMASKPLKNVEEDMSPGAIPEPEEGGKPDPKRKNRRRRGKAKPSPKDSGQGSENEAPDGGISDPAQIDGDEPQAGKDKSDTPNGPKNAQQQQHKPRHKLDRDKLAKNAWKIFLAEVSEEGVALIGDSDARELARRCFRLAEIFLEEEDRRG